MPWASRIRPDAGADDLLIVGDDDAERCHSSARRRTDDHGKLGLDVPATVREWTGVEVPSQCRRPFGHPEQAESSWRTARRIAVVRDQEMHETIGAAHVDVDVGRANGVSSRIGDRFACDAMDGGEHGVRERCGVVVDGDAHRQLAALLRSGGRDRPQLVDRCRRRELTVSRLLAQGADHRSHRRQRSAAGQDDSVERPLRRFRVVAGHQLRSLCLHHDSCHVVGDDVVQLPGDREALLVADVRLLLELSCVEHSQVPTDGDDGDPGAGTEEEQLVGVPTLVAPFDDGVEREPEGQDRGRCASV